MAHGPASGASAVTEGLGPCCGWEPAPTRSAFFAWRVLSAGGVFSQRWWHLRCSGVSRRWPCAPPTCAGLHCRHEGGGSRPGPVSRPGPRVPQGWPWPWSSHLPLGEPAGPMPSNRPPGPPTASSLGHRSEAAALHSLHRRAVCLLHFPRGHTPLSSAGWSPGLRGACGPGRRGREVPAFSEMGLFL